MSIQIKKRNIISALATFLLLRPSNLLPRESRCSDFHQRRLVCLVLNSIKMKVYSMWSFRSCLFCSTLYVWDSATLSYHIALAHWFSFLNSVPLYDSKWTKTASKKITAIETMFPSQKFVPQNKTKKGFFIYILKEKGEGPAGTLWRRQAQGEDEQQPSQVL